MENDARRGEEGGEGSRLIEAILESTALQRFLRVKGLDFKEAAPIQRGVERLLTVRENSGRLARNLESLRWLLRLKSISRGEIPGRTGRKVFRRQSGFEAKEGRKLERGGKRLWPNRVVALYVLASLLSIGGIARLCGLLSRN